MADETIYKAFGQAVAVRRRQLDLKQADLAARVGMSRASIANIESGRQNVLLHVAYALAEALDYADVSELLPATPRSLSRAYLDEPVSGADLTAQDRLHISDLLSTALGARNATKASS